MFKKVNPKQDFDKLEQSILDSWKKGGVFDKSIENRKDGKTYVFYDGPPFATGLPHYGHLLASTVKDVVPRYKTMRGFKVPRKWGWDCHGLPVENLIEKELGLNSRKDIEEYGIDKFNAKAKASVLRYDKEWKEIIDRLGRWVDFEGSYKTMDNDYMESVWWGFKKLYDEGLVYKGQRSSLFCPRCSTPLSKFEIAMDNSYKDVDEETVFVKYKLTEESVFNKKRISKLGIEGDTYFLAWTTTPWTLPANVALAVNDKTKYVLAKKEKESYVLAKKTLSVLGKGFKIVKEFRTKELIGLEYQPQFGDRQRSAIENKSDKNRKALQNLFKIYAGDFVTTDEGTGIVHIASGYGEDDFDLAKQENLPIFITLDEEGKFNIEDNKAGSFYKKLKGVYFKDANKLVKTELGNLLLKTASIKHSYPFCWRCDTPLYYTAQDAWFINVQKIKDKAIEANKKINWYPKHLKKGRFKKGLDTAPDWNVSRSRFWGTPMPIWECAECSKVQVIGSKKELGEVVRDIDVNDPNFDFHRPYIDKAKIKCECGSKMNRIPDVFDCWVESGSMPFASRHYPFENEQDFDDNFPAEFITEYIAQTRGWFYTMHILSVALFEGKPAFKHAVTTGTIMAEDGTKMSKSKKNFPDPMLLIEKYGVDSLRFYLMASNVMKGEKVDFAESGVRDVTQNIVLRLWNVYSFFVTYASIDKWKPEKDNTKFKELHLLDKWVLSRLQTLVDVQTKLMDNYQINKAAGEFEKFIDELANWYVRRSRRRFWKSENDSDKNQAYQTLHTVLITLAKLMAPFMPFITENIYTNLTNQEIKTGSVHLSDYPEVKKGLVNEELEKQMDQVLQIVRLGLSLRNQANIKARQPLEVLQISGVLIKDQDLLDLIKDEVNVKQIEFVRSLPKFVESEIVLDKAKLGKKHGKALAIIISQVRTGEYEVVEDNALQVAEFTLNSDEFTVRHQSKDDDWKVVSEQQIVVLLNVKITKELALEGQARDLIRALQEARRKEGLEVSDRINVKLEKSKIVSQILKYWQEEVSKEVLAISISEGVGVSDYEVKLNGKAIKFALRKSNGKD